MGAAQLLEGKLVQVETQETTHGNMEGTLPAPEGARREGGSKEGGSSK